MNEKDFFILETERLTRLDDSGAGPGFCGVIGPARFLSGMSKAPVLAL